MSPRESTDAHRIDADCIRIEALECLDCHVSGDPSDPCRACNGVRYHNDGCPDSDATPSRAEAYGADAREYLALGWTAHAAAAARAAAHEANATAAAVERARLSIQAAEPRPAARARILREYHAAGRHDARPVADCRDCLTVRVPR